MYLSEETISEIRAKASISEVIGHYIPVFKKGRNYVAKCPFHDDHDPSLSISEDKQIYKCFVCGEGGNVFTFVERYKDVSFIEAVKEVADIIGYPLDLKIEKKAPKPLKYQRYYDLLSEVIKFSSYLLFAKGGQKALAYLEGRGLSKEVIEYFDIGYNPLRNVMREYLKKLGYSDEEMIKTNVVRLNQRGEYDDVFYGRILFPIHDENAHAIAFSGREIDGQGPKYVNTSETLIYKKGDILYNLHRAKSAIKRAKRVIVAEGVMDVIAFKRADIDFVVATLGTALTLNQIELLKGLNARVVFSYDGDKAGQNATMKALELCLDNKVEAFVLKNNSGLDPDEIINKGKEKNLRDLLSNEVSCIEFALDYYEGVYPLRSYDNRVRYDEKISSLIAKLANEEDRLNFLHELNAKTHLRFREELIKPVSNRGQIVYNREEVSFLDGVSKAQAYIILMMLKSKRAFEIYREELGYLLEEPFKELALLISEAYRSNRDLSLADILDHLDKRWQSIFTSLALDDELNEYSDEKLNDYIATIKRSIMQNRVIELKKLIKDNTGINDEALMKYSKELLDIMRKLGGSK